MRICITVYRHIVDHHTTIHKFDDFIYIILNTYSFLAYRILVIKTYVEIFAVLWYTHTNSHKQHSFMPGLQFTLFRCVRCMLIDAYTAVYDLPSAHNRTVIPTLATLKPFCRRYIQTVACLYCFFCRNWFFVLQCIAEFSYFVQQHKKKDIIHTTTQNQVVCQESGEQKNPRSQTNVTDCVPVSHGLK